MLCCWKLFDDNHLISHALYKLSDDVRVDSNHGPTINGAPGSASKEAENLEK